MSASVIVDLVIAVIFLLSVVLGVRRGLFRSLAELVALVLAVLLAAKCGAVVSDYAVEQILRPAARSAIEMHIADLIEEDMAVTAPLEELEEILDAIPYDLLRREAQKLLEDIAVSREEEENISAREALRTLAEGVLDTALESVVRNVLHTVIFVAVFLLLRLIFGLVIRALDLPLRLPVLRQLNELGGLLFGAAKGAVLVWLVCCLLVRAQFFLTPEQMGETVALRQVVALFADIGLPVS